MEVEEWRKTGSVYYTGRKPKSKKYRGGLGTKLYIHVCSRGSVLCCNCMLYSEDLSQYQLTVIPFDCRVIIW